MRGEGAGEGEREGRGARGEGRGARARSHPRCSAPGVPHVCYMWYMLRMLHVCMLGTKRAAAASSS